jgi:hypothetical protein
VLFGQAVDYPAAGVLSRLRKLLISEADSMFEHKSRIQVKVDDGCGSSITTAMVVVSVLAMGAVAADGDTTSAFFALQPVKDDFSATILDCSRWIEAPTGKHGFVTVKQDKFVFEDGTPVRFWGAQMNLWSKEQIDYAVRRMRRQGINITRMHGLGFLNDRDAKTSIQYSKEGFDQLDYLVAKLSENGIYVILDPHYPLTSRFKPGDNIEQLPDGGPAPYAQFFNEKVDEITRRRMVDILTHYNPYTKKRYCDDPAIAMVEILNEDSLFWGATVAEPFTKEFEEKFAAWLKKKYGDNDGLQKAWTVDGRSSLKAGEGIEAGQRIGLIRNYDFTPGHLKSQPEDRIRGRDQLQYCYELEHSYWQSCIKALREAGLRVPISGTNWQGHGFTTRIHMLAQSKLDYVDRHGYWDHPAGEGNRKWRIDTALFHNLPMVKDVKADKYELVYLGVGNLVTDKAWEQVLGLPMTISEWNTCLPNEYSLEGTGLMAAYGLLQGWDASLQFGYFSPDWRTKLGPGSFDMFGNPPQILQYPAIATMWHRGDVKEADLVAESVYDDQSVFEWSDDKKPLPIAAALVGKVGYRFVDKTRPPVVKDISKYWDSDKLIARSMTGELTWDASAGIVLIDTPRTQAVIGFLSARPHALTDVHVNSSTNFGAVYVTAMDANRPITAAKRLLITAVGPARNTGMEYEQTSEKTRMDGAPYWRLKKVGDEPALLEAVTGGIEIRCEHAKSMKCWALDIVGKRTGGIPLKASGDKVVLDMKSEYKTVYYEISIE